MSNKNIKIVFIGEASVGKSSICEMIKNKKFNNDIKPTIGVDFHTNIFDNIRIQIWDTSGQKKFRFIIETYLRNSSLNVLVFDLSDYDTFLSLDNFIKTLKKFNDSKIILVGNKADLISNIAYDEIEKYVESNNLEYIEVSSKINLNIDYLKKMINDSLLFDIPIENNSNNENTKLLLNEKNKKNKNLLCSCCSCF